MRQIKKNIKAYAQNKDGNFAVWFAVMAFPLVAAISLVIDYRTTEANMAGIKTALDTAVLAAVSNDSLDSAAKEALAEEVFDLHYKGAAKLQLSPKATDGRVEMTASGEIGTSVGRAVGYNKFDISETSIAEMNRENTICVLALAMEGREKLRFLDSTEFNSPTCSVQSNSKDAVGVMSTTKHAPVAKSFCSAGGAVGDFLPNLRGQCRQIGDPYINRSAPTPGLCMPSSIFQSTSHTSVLGDLSVEDLTVGGILKLTSGNKSWVKFLDFGTVFSILGSGFDKNNPAEVAIVEAALVEEVLKALRLSELGLTDRQIERLEQDYSADLLEVAESTNYTGHNMVLSPGTYCGGLTVDGKNVTFLPGTYIMKDGPLTFKNGSQATAKDVSFVMHGKTAVVTVETNSYVDVKAPRSGTMAGLAFFQDQNVKLTGLQKDQLPPTGVNIVSSGGELNVTGTMYFPTQALEVVGDSILGAKAPATSFIAHQVTFSGETKAAVQVDHVKGGIPPMLPRSDDGARLVK